MEEITAIILAAGQGVRMGPRGQLTPKGLIKVGGAPLVVQSVETLRRGGLNKICIVTGHLAEQYEAIFAGQDVQLIHNPEYATLGSLFTLLTALDEIEGPVLIVESDIIYAPQVLSAVTADENRFLTSTPTGAGDEVYAWVDPQAPGEDRLIMISKDLKSRPEAPFAEMIGLTCLSAEAVQDLRRIGARVQAEAPMAHYEEDGILALANEVPIRCMRFDGVPWAEMDDEEMLASVKASVWPRIKDARAALWGAEEA